eukprot:2562057-Alexandrium_andersonii.AAC.1
MPQTRLGGPALDSCASSPLCFSALSWGAFNKQFGACCLARTDAPSRFKGTGACRDRPRRPPFQALSPAHG